MIVITSLLRQNIFIRRNNNFILDLQYKPNGTIITTDNLNSAYLQIRPYKGSNVLFLQASLDNQMIKFSGNDGGIHINIPYDVTRDLPQFDDSFYDLIIIDSNSIAHTLIEGVAVIEKSVGRIADGYNGVGAATGTGSPINSKTYTLDWSFIEGKPNFATVATSGSYGDLVNKPAIFSGVYDDLRQKPIFGKIAVSSNYDDLINVPVKFDPSPHQHNYADIIDPPKPLVFKDIWVSTTNYDVNNLVLRNNSTYIALIANKGIDPEINYNEPSITNKTWQLIAKAGTNTSGGGTDTGNTGGTANGNIDGGNY